MRDKVIDVLSLQSQVALAIAEENSISGLPGSTFGSPHDRRKERICNVRNYEADCLGFMGEKAPRDPVGRVVKRMDRILDALLSFTIDSLPPVDDPRHCHCRYASQFSDITQSSWHKISC